MLALSDNHDLTVWMDTPSFSATDLVIGHLAEVKIKPERLKLECIRLAFGDEWIVQACPILRQAQVEQQPPGGPGNPPPPPPPPQGPRPSALLSPQNQSLKEQYDRTELIVAPNPATTRKPQYSVRTFG